MGNPTVYGGNNPQSAGTSRSQSDVRTSQVSPCPAETIDMQLKLPGHQRCLTSTQLATEIISNVLTGGASGTAKLVGGIAQEAGVDNPYARKAMTIAMRNSSVQEALFAEATRNPAAVVGLVGQLERFDLQHSLPFISELGTTARSALSAVGEAGGKILHGAIEVGGQVADGAVEVGGAVVRGAKGVLGGIGTFLGGTPEPAPPTPAPQAAPASRTIPVTIPTDYGKKSRF